MKKKRFVLSGYFGFKNFGDEAILSVLVHKLQQHGHRITIISSDTKYTVSKFKHIRSVYTFKISDIIGAISKSDYLISGGGSLLQDATSIKSLIYYLGIIFIALILQKKVIIFAQGIGPINSKFGLFLTKTLLKHCTYISVRDTKSKSLLEDAGIKAELVCDPVFSSKVKIPQKNKTVAIQLRDCKMMNEDFIDRLALKISKEFSDYEIGIFPFQKDLDTEVSKKFQNALKLLNPEIKTTIFEDITDEEIIEEIAKCEYLIAMRFHAIIIGLLTNTKTLAINYDIKIEKIASEFNLPIINLIGDFKNRFQELKNTDLEKISEKVKTKTFNWENFEKVINN